MLSRTLLLRLALVTVAGTAAGVFPIVAEFGPRAAFADDDDEDEDEDDGGDDDEGGEDGEEEEDEEEVDEDQPPVTAGGLALERKTFGVPIAQHQAIQFILAEMAIAAVALAEAGEPYKAWQQIVTGVGDNTFEDSDWYALGRIAETYGLRDDALAYYRRILGQPGATLVPLAIDFAAQRRAILGAP